MSYKEQQLAQAGVAWEAEGKARGAYCVRTEDEDLKRPSDLETTHW